MRKDQGVSGDAQRIEQLGWLITLKIIDDKDKELELISDKYKSPIPSKLQWRNWAADEEGMTGDELKEFIDRTLFPGLKNLDVSTGNKRALIIREIFEGTNNYMKKRHHYPSGAQSTQSDRFQHFRRPTSIRRHLRNNSQRPSKRRQLRGVLHSAGYYRIHDRNH